MLLCNKVCSLLSTWKLFRWCTVFHKQPQIHISNPHKALPFYCNVFYQLWYHRGVHFIFISRFRPGCCIIQSKHSPPGPYNSNGGEFRALGLIRSTSIHSVVHIRLNNTSKWHEIKCNNMKKNVQGLYSMPVIVNHLYAYIQSTCFYIQFGIM